MGMIWVAYRRAPDGARLFLEDPDLVEDRLESDDEESSVDLDKAWHGVHWLLTGSAEPTPGSLSGVIFGGEEFGEDLGYGPARLLEPELVSAVADALDADDQEDALRDRFDPATMRTAGLYPDIWDEADLMDSYLLPAVAQLRRFYRAAADGGSV